MKIDKFYVVKLKDSNKATILDKKSRNKYFAEIVNSYGFTLEKRTIKNDEINKVIHKKKIQR